MMEIIEEETVELKYDFVKPQYMLEGRTDEYLIDRVTEKQLRKIIEERNRLNNLISLDNDISNIVQLLKGSIKRREHTSKTQGIIFQADEELLQRQNEIKRKSIGDDSDKIIEFLSNLIDEISNSTIPFESNDDTFKKMANLT